MRGARRRYSRHGARTRAVHRIRDGCSGVFDRPVGTPAMLRWVARNGDVFAGNRCASQIFWVLVVARWTPWRSHALAAMGGRICGCATSIPAARRS